MRRTLYPLVVALTTCTGCVEATEPIGDIDMAESDKGLVGTWTVADARGLAEQFKVERLTIDAPEVKGNPKGLMRGNDNTWFYLTTIGKHTYASLLGVERKDLIQVYGVVRDNRDPDPFDLNKEGGFEKWHKRKDKQLTIAKVSRDGDQLTLDWGNVSMVANDVGIGKDTWTRPGRPRSSTERNYLETQARENRRKEVDREVEVCGCG